MHKRFVVAMLAFLFIVFGLSFQNASAISPNIVLSQLQLGNAASASNEFIEIYNNADSDTEITNSCLYYASATSNLIGSKLGCFVPENDSLHLYLPTHAFAFGISTVLSTAQPTLGSDLKFSATLSGTAGHVRLIDSLGSEIDKVGWGTTAISPETLYTATAPVGKVLQRKISTVTNVLQDSDNNSIDFELALPKTNYAYGAIYEVQDLCKNISGIQQSLPTGYSVDSGDSCLPPPVDVCTNIDGLQMIVPAGYALDSGGLCQPDICNNITGLQLVMPSGQELDSNGNCVNHDYCVNLSGIQAAVPPGYFINSSYNCLLDLLPIRVNELLPNAAGSDDGNEFIELYNPNPAPVDLSFYLLKIGITSPKLYAFPSGSAIGPSDYIIFSDDDIAFTLVNTDGQVSIVSNDGQLINESPSYSSPDEGMAWALIDGSWQYTNQPTPWFDNLQSAVEIENVVEVVIGLKPCAANQYRNLETNRCRLLVTVGSTLIACKDGQYRSETTNRCRSIADDASNLTPCNANQQRNPETNRCRLIASSDTTLTPCKDGQERNEDTNRCRNVSGGVPNVPFAVEPVVDTGNGLIGWWALGGILIIALAYAGWEWRAELIGFIRKFGTFFHSEK